MLRGIPLGAIFLFVLAAFAEQDQVPPGSASHPESASGAAAAKSSQVVRLEDGTPVRIRTTKDISSGKAKKYVEAGSTLTAFVDGNVSFDDAALRSSQPPRKRANGLATVFILRSEKHGLKKPAIYCGAVAIGELHGRHYMEVQVPPGDYLLQSPGIESTVQLHATAEQSYYVQFRPNGFLDAGKMELMDAMQGDDLLAFPWWIAETKVDLSGADLSKLQDTKQLPKPAEE